jgi:hypothetical protein
MESLRALLHGVQEYGGQELSVTADCLFTWESSMEMAASGLCFMASRNIVGRN